jgi:hypothetical protein
MAVGDIVYGSKMSGWYSTLNTIRSRVGLGSVGTVNPTGSTALASHINTLVDNITNTFFATSRIYAFSAAPTTVKVAIGDLIQWDTAARIDATLANMNTASSFSTQSTQSTNGTNSTNSNFSNFGTNSNFSNFGTNSDFSNFGTNGTCSFNGNCKTFSRCGNNATNWVFSDTCFTFKGQRTRICGTASNTNCSTTN